METGRNWEFGLLALVLVLLLDCVSAHGRRNNFYGMQRQFGGISLQQRIPFQNSISGGIFQNRPTQGIGGMAEPRAEPNKMLRPMPEPRYGRMGPMPGLGGMAEPNKMLRPMPEPRYGRMGPMQGLGGMAEPVAEPNKMLGRIPHSGQGMMNPMFGQTMGQQMGMRPRNCGLCGAGSRCVPGRQGMMCIPYGPMQGMPRGGIDVCRMFKDPGNCHTARYVRYFYNAEHRHCERFNWSGCGGNMNRFISRRACEYRCMKPMHKRYRHAG